MAIIRKNQKVLTGAEWSDFIAAINATHGMGIPAPRYRDFVSVHVRAMDMMDPVGMSWSVHTMGAAMPGRNFLAWHRQFVAQLEKRLRVVKPNVTIPYWDWMKERNIPEPLSDPALLSEWGVTRGWDESQLPTEADFNAVMARIAFGPFQRILELTIHGSVHNAVGGTMASSRSPADPLFWLHHANVDRIWADWQSKNPGQDPPNLNENLLPEPILGNKVSTVVEITAMGYEYQ